MAKQMAYDKDFSSEAEISVYRRYFNALFPKVDTMSYKFDYDIKDKMKFATSAMSISQKRNNLIKKLEL